MCGKLNTSFFYIICSHAAPSISPRHKTTTENPHTENETMFLQHFSIEQIRQLALMCNKMVGNEEKVSQQENKEVCQSDFGEGTKTQDMYIILIVIKIYWMYIRNMCIV